MAGSLLVVFAACAPKLSPLQERAWDAFKDCQSQAPSAMLDQISEDGGISYTTREGRDVGNMQAVLARAMGLPLPLRMRRAWLAILVVLPSCVTTAPELRPPTAEVPIQVISNIVFVSATVNGGPSALLIVDTGADRTILTPRLLGRLGVVVPADAPKRKIRVIGGQTLDVPFIKVATIRVREAVMTSPEIGVYDILPDEPVIDGLLGGDFLQRFKVTLDRTAKQMRLEPLAR